MMAPFFHDYKDCTFPLRGDLPHALSSQPAESSSCSAAHCVSASAAMATRYRFTVSDENAGKRLDQAIAAHVTEISRTRARVTLNEGGVFVEKKRVKQASKPVYEGQEIEVNLSAEVAALSSAKDEAPIVEIVAKTENYLVVNKPSGVFSAPTPESDRHDLLRYLKDQEQTGELFLVHRLDRPTSGLMVLALNKKTAADLSVQVTSHTMRRKYLAALVGEIPDTVVQSTPIGGKAAETEFKRLESKEEVTLISANLRTGRTHQVRIHADALDAPVAGDSKYGRRKQRQLTLRAPRLALHAYQLSFFDSESGKRVDFECAWPDELETWWQKLGNSTLASGTAKEPAS